MGTKNWRSKMMNDAKGALSKYQYISFLFFVGLTILVRIIYMSRAKGPIVYTDEMGYWAHAANLTGNSWAGVMQEMPWYAYGYSLLLIPIFALSNDIIEMYRLAIIVNIILSVLSYIIASKLIRRLLKNQSEWMINILAFAATSYSTYIFQSYIAWSETLCVFLIWLILYEVVKLEEKANFLGATLLGITTGYGYMVHNRFLAIILAVVCCCLILTAYKCIEGKHLICVIGALVITLLMSLVLEGMFKNLIVANPQLKNCGIVIELGDANTFADQLKKVESLFSISGMKQFLINIIGQIWECLSSTYLIFGFGVIYCVKKIWTGIKNENVSSIYLFPFLAFIFTLAMTALFFIDKEVVAIAGERVRLDYVIYGRYNAVVLGVFIIFGLLCILEEKAFEHYITIGVVFCVFSIVIYCNIGRIEDFYLNTVSAVGIYIFHWLGEFTVWKCVAIASAIALLYIVISRVNMDICLKYYAICLMLIGLFGLTSLNCMKLVIRGENDNIQKYQEIYDFLNNNVEKNELIYTSEQGKFAYDLQTRVVDKPVISGDVNQMYMVDDAYIVIHKEKYDKCYTICLQVEDYMIVQKA